MSKKELVEEVAEIARIDLGKEEVERFSQDLEDVLEAFSVLDEADVEGMDPSFRPINTRNVLRKDEPGDCLSQEEVFKSVKNKKDGFFKGPRTVDS